MALPSDRRSRIVLLGALAALIAALIVGISDNPPGIILAYAACFGGIAALTTGWNRPRPFLILAVLAVAGFVVFALLHNAFYALADVGSGLPVVPSVASALSVVAFFLAVLVCPAALVVGLAGALKTWLQRRRPAPA